MQDTAVDQETTTTTELQFVTTIPPERAPLPSNATERVTLAPAKTLCEPIDDLNVEFVSGTATFSGSTSGIDTVVSRLEDLNQIEGERASVTIVGHTDSVPASNYPGGNQGLSEDRARTVVQEIVARGESDIDVSMLAEPVGVADRDPRVDPEVTSQDRARNRRVEVRFECG